jgi:glycine/D-amino acid oxidase-like deaminating enzyme
MTAATELDTLVIGGGVVGMSVAYGLARAGERVCVLDQGDDAFRAARGNFGLVWVQGKGHGRPDYARWTLDAARRWPAFAAELAQGSGIDVELSQVGGLNICLDEEELASRAAVLRDLHAQVGEAYPYEVLDQAALRRLSPHVGPDVAGAVFCPLDGHVSPLRLLRALVHNYQSLGGRMQSGVQVDQISHRSGQFHVRTGGAEHVAGKLVLAAGLGNRVLAPMVGLSAPVAPNRGQILVSERMQPFLVHPSLHVRQTGEGVVQIGDSKEDVGLDDGTTLKQLSRIAARAVRCFPLLAQVNVVRTWGALRVMSPDGLPIYQASTQCPGAFVVSCHSGITLAAQHAGKLVDWIRGAAAPAEIAGFNAERFDV